MSPNRGLLAAWHSWTYYSHLLLSHYRLWCLLSGLSSSLSETVHCARLNLSDWLFFRLLLYCMIFKVPSNLRHSVTPWQKTGASENSTQEVKVLDIKDKFYGKLQHCFAGHCFLFQKYGKKKLGLVWRGICVTWKIFHNHMLFCQKLKKKNSKLN